MTRNELEHIAAKQGFVRWLRSGIVERLIRTSEGGVIAKNTLTGKLHFISRRDDNWCVEVDPNDRVTLGSIIGRRAGV